MQARKLLDGAAYGPAALKVICQAFDNAWAEIGHHFDDPLTAECARLKLANAILVVAREDSRDVEDLKKKGLHALALRHSVDSAVEVATGRRKRSSSYWRAHAEETLTIADQMTNPECKRMLVGVAETYTQLARHAAAAEVERLAEKALDLVQQRSR
jgi:hypothetical protein